MSESRIFTRHTVLLASAALPLLLIAAGCDLEPNDDAAAAEESAPAGAARIETVPVELQDLTRQVEMAGTVEGFETVDLYSKVGGYLGEINVDIGDPISEGDVLAKLLIPETEKQLAQKEALIRQAEAEIEQAVQSIRQAEAALASAEATLAETEAERAEKQAQLDYRRTEYERAAELFETRSVREDVLDSARYQWQAAQAALGTVNARVTSSERMLDAARADLEKAKADKKAAEARRDVAEADADYVRTMMQYSEIRAPFDGHVTERWMDSGAFVQPAEGNSAARPILTVARTDTVRVFVDIPMNDVRRLDRGDRAVLSRINVLPGEIFEGEITRFSASLHKSSRMMRVEIDLPNEEQRLLPGYYGYVTIYLEENPQTPVIPSSAMMTDAEGAYVYTVSDGKAHKRRITPIFQDGAVVGVESGDLQPGEQVVRAGGGQLTDGQPVQTADAET